jgi:hypothetical protein
MTLVRAFFGRLEQKLTVKNIGSFVGSFLMVELVLKEF